MDNFLIVADSSGNELRALMFSAYDFEVGKEENSFEITIKRQEYESIPDRARIYIPGTEYGGLFRRMSTNTKEGTISPGGLTWRGMMQKKIIEPLAGDDYATDSGELNAIIRNRVEAALPGLFIGTDESTGVTVNWQYDRYCTLEDGLEKMLKSKGYRLNIEYSQVQKAVVVSAVPIVNYASNIEFSSDMRINYLMQMQDDGINHLICLGQGELKDRTVYHLYIDQNGNVGTTPYYTGTDEVAEVYDYAGAELEDLIQTGTYHIRELANTNVFEITVDPDMEIAIGDIVGGRDYLSGMSMQSPITGKIVRWANGFQTIEYKLEDDVSVELSAPDAAKSIKLSKVSKEEIVK